MLTSKSAFTAIILLGLAGCATNSESPIYTQNTTYKVDSPYETQSPAPVYPAGDQTTPVNYGTPLPRDVQNNAPSVSLASNAPDQAPTDSAYGDTYGTPGYHAMQANGEFESETSSTEPSVTITQSETSQSVAEVTAPTSSYPHASQYSYVTSDPSEFEAGDKDVIMHRVVEGDTVYSLSRRQCVSVEDIQALNSLNSEFYIRLRLL